MKLATQPYKEPQKDRGFGRMILLSAMLHVVVIGALLVTGYFRSPKPKAPPVTSYEVSLIGPTGTGKRKGANERTSTPTPPRQIAVEKPTVPPAVKEEPREAFLPKPQEKPKPEVQPKPKPQEPSPAEKPQEVAKKIEPPKPKPLPVVKEKEPPKAVADVKPVEKPLPPEKKLVEAKVKKPAKPEVDVRLSEKKEKPKEKLPQQPERIKVQEKKPEVRKTEEKPKIQPPPSKPGKKSQEPVKTTAVEKVNEPKKTENPQKKPAVAVPVAKAMPSVDAAQERKDEEAREKLIASAVERVRTREEAVSRERDIAKAVHRVRQNVGSREDKGSETEKNPAANANKGKVEGDDHIAKAKVYGAEFLAYTEDIKQRVKDNWIIVDRKPGLTTVVQFGVEADGAVIDVELAESSGDRSFDQSALRAVKNTKLPPPPEMYREDFVLQKVRLTFGGEE